MPESIERILEALAPHLRSELNILGYSARSPERDDLLQEIQVRIWKALKDREGEIEHLNAYVKKVVFSVFINETNRLRRERRMISAAENEQYLGNDDRRNCDDPGSVLREIIIESLAALGETKRRTIELRLEGFTFAEIAQLNHWSLRKACNLYYRGIGDLKKKLLEKGIQYED